MTKKISKTVAFILMLGIIFVSVAGCYPANAGSDLQLQIEPQEDDDEMIDPIDVDGAFYSLQRAYDNEWLTISDLQSIANHQNQGTKPSDILSAELKAEIKETAAENLRTNSTNPIPEATAADITIIKYYGTYNNCIAVMISNIYTESSAALRDVEVAGIMFNYFNGNSITVWKQK